MFSWKRDSADISDDEPIFRARYVGCTETLVATGQGCTSVPLRRIWGSQDRKSPPALRKVTIQISTRGIFMYDVDKSRSCLRPTTKQHGATATEVAVDANGFAHDEEDITRRCSRYFCMEDISYCAAADSSTDDRIFCWICRNLDTFQMELHAVLCSCKEKAQTMAAVLSRAFRHAYRHWKTDRMRNVRRDQGVDEEEGRRGGGGGGGGGGQLHPCIGLAIYGSGGNPLSKVKLEKGSQRVGSKSTTSV